MQMSMNLSVSRRGEVFKVVSDRGIGGHDLFSCMCADGFIKVYVRNGEPVYVRHPLCFLDLGWARRCVRIWHRMRPSWRFSIWRGMADGIMEIRWVCGALEIVSPEVIDDLWATSINHQISEMTSILRCPAPPSTIICEGLALISEV